MNNRPKFIITGLSRSGTKFLSQIMNRTKKCNVYHDYNIHNLRKKGCLNLEERKGKLLDCFEDLKSTLIHKEGFISAAYRLYLRSLPCEQEGLILRHPEKILNSYLKMHKNIKSVKKVFIDHIEEELEGLDQIAKRTARTKIIKFDRMVNDVEYLQEVMNRFGLEDVKVNKKDLKKKVNAIDNDFSINDLDKEVLQDFRKKSEWFAKKYDLYKI